MFIKIDLCITLSLLSLHLSVSIPPIYLPLYPSIPLSLSFYSSITISNQYIQSIVNRVM